VRTLYDSITATDIPTGAQMVAGYVNGTFQWSDADWARFPNATKVRIATRAWINDGHVLDVETGDAVPGQAPAWVEMRRAAGVDPTVYCNASTQVAVQAAFNAAGVPQPHYWIAHYDNVPTLPPGAVAKQYINDPISGGHYDLSVVADYWPGVDPAGPQPATFPPSPDDEESTVLVPAGTDHVTLITHGKTRLVLGCGFGDQVTIHSIDGWGTNASGWNSIRVGVGGHIGEFVLNPDEPLDIPLQNGEVLCSISYTANHSFAAGAA
jgi:hypothetical protein